MTDENLTSLTADIAAAFVANNRVTTGEIAGLIKSVHEALVGLGKSPEPAAPTFEPATTIRKSLSDPTKIISMIDGKPYSMLKRHLGQHGLTPAEYRSRYNLPTDYPMVAPAYSEQRKSLAVKIGLGRKPKAVEAAPAPEAEPAPAPAKPGRKPRVAKAEPAPAPAAAAVPAKRGRKPKAAVAA